MKKIKFITVLCIIALFTSIIMNSCKKENNAISETKENNNFSQKDLKINRLISGFIEKMENVRENPALKSGDEMPADSALWYIEATMNYSHSFPNEYYKEFKIDSAYFSIDKKTNGEVDLDELTQKYGALKSEVTNLYYASEFENKGLAVVDLTEISQTNDEISIMVETFTGNRGTNPPDPQIDGPFEQGDNWMYGDLLGKCTGNEFIVSDAAEELFNEIVNEIPDPNGQYYFINHYIYIIEGGDDLIRRDDWNDPEDNHLDYLLYFATTKLGPNSCGDDTLCLERNEMNLYYSYLKYLIFSYLPENAPELQGKTIEEVLDVEGYSEYVEPYIEYKHYLETMFGDKIEYLDGDGPTEL